MFPALLRRFVVAHEHAGVSLCKVRFPTGLAALWKSLYNNAFV